jgi:hypothetical protein
MKDSTKKSIACRVRPVRADSGEQHLENFLDLVAKLIARAHVRQSAAKENPDDLEAISDLRNGPLPHK